MPLRHVALALLVVAIWGFNFVVIKLSVHALPPILAAALRFLLAAVPAMIFVRPPRAPWRLVVGYGLSFGFALYSLLNLSLFFGMPAGLASLVLQVQAFFTTLFAFLLLGERPRLPQIAGAGIAFGGIALIALQQGAGASLGPLALTVGAAIAWGVANVLTKKAGRVDAVAFTVWGSAVAPLPLLALSLLVEGPATILAALTGFSWWDAGLIAFLAYPATLLGAGIFAWLLGRHPASTVAPFTLLVPITGLLSGSLVLGEPLTGLDIAGGGLVIAGLAITVLRPRGTRAVAS